eukprot:6532300-Alexandrium_andersonii.AAC.1
MEPPRCGVPQPGPPQETRSPRWLGCDDHLAPGKRSFAPRTAAQRRPPPPGRRSSEVPCLPSCVASGTPTAWRAAKPLPGTCG